MTFLLALTGSFVPYQRPTRSTSSAWERALLGDVADLPREPLMVGQRHVLGRQDHDRDIGGRGVGAQPLDHVEAVQSGISRSTTMTAGRARRTSSSPSSPPAAPTRSSPPGRAPPRGDPAPPGHRRSPRACGGRARYDAPGQRVEQLVAVDRLDEVFGGAQREPGALFVDHRDDDHRDPDVAGSPLSWAALPAVQPRQQDSRITAAGPRLRASARPSLPSRATTTRIPLRDRRAGARPTIVVLHDEHAARWRPALPTWATGRRRGTPGERDGEGERASGAGLALHPQATAVEIDDALRQRESEAGALVLVRAVLPPR